MARAKDESEEQVDDNIPVESQGLLGIKGVGPKTAVKLIDAGIATPEDLAGARYQDLAAITKMNKKAVKDMVDDAIEKYLDKAVVLDTFASIAKHQKEIVQRIPTGVQRFDMAMEGGVMTEAITIFKGEYESGKSQFCYQLAVNCLKYLKRKVVWIETESGTFVASRFRQVADAQGLKFDEDKDLTVITSSVARNERGLYLSYMRIEKEVEAGEKDVGLIIVDSFSAPFLKDFNGREQLPDRFKAENKHLGKLDEIAKKWNCAVVLTAQIMANPDTGLGFSEMAKSGSNKTMQGGNAVKHGGTYLISLEQKGTLQYEGVIFGSPNVPRTAFRFKIVPQGVRDV